MTVVITEILVAGAGLIPGILPYTPLGPRKARSKLFQTIW